MLQRCVGPRKNTTTDAIKIYLKFFLYRLTTVSRGAAITLLRVLHISDTRFDVIYNGDGAWVSTNPRNTASTADALLSRVFEP